MRYRFVIDQNDTYTRWKSWDKQFDSPSRTHPFDTVTGYSLNGWSSYVNDDNVYFDANYAYRHIATTHNMDRIINPDGSKMFNINSPLDFNANAIYNAVRAALDPCVFKSADVAQITANLMDYIDGPNYPVGTQGMTPMTRSPSFMMTVILRILASKHPAFTYQKSRRTFINLPASTTLTIILSTLAQYIVLTP